MISFCSNPEKWCGSVGLAVPVSAYFVTLHELLSGVIYIWVHVYLHGPSTCSVFDLGHFSLEVRASLYTFNTIHLGQGEKLDNVSLPSSQSTPQRLSTSILMRQDVKSQGGELRAGPGLGHEEISIYIHCRVQEGPGTCDNTAQLHF